jgi:hypothetical protein
VLEIWRHFMAGEPGVKTMCQWWRIVVFTDGYKVRDEPFVSIGRAA